MFSVKSHALGRWGLGVRIVAGFATTSVNSNHYEALGISKNSTQADIKAAYYKLSMQYHPDKNQGCTMSANKFREITQAYEVLGNYRLRRLYDKGGIHVAGTKDADVTEDYPEPDDAETKFYKSRFTKSTVSNAEGRTPIYNFDEWSQAHYGDSFQRRKDAKQKWEKMQARDQHNIKSSQNEVFLYGLVMCAVFVYAFFLSDSNHDIPKKKEQIEAEDSTNTT